MTRRVSRTRDLAAMPRPKRKPTDSAHLAWVRTLPCVSCGSPGPNEAAHYRQSVADLPGHSGGMGMKPTDNRVLPLCKSCHGRQHSVGEVTFWPSDPSGLADYLYRINGEEDRDGKALRAIERFQLRTKT